MNTNRAIDYVVSQTRENISFLLSVQQISPGDARDILNKLPRALRSPLKSSEMDRSFPTPYSDSWDSQNNSVMPLAKSSVHPLTTRSPPPIPAPSLFKAKAVWSYNEDGKEPNDLSFSAGDIIEVTDEKNQDWWTGRLDGKGGVFPSSYVQKLPRDPPYRPPPSNVERPFPEQSYQPQNQPNGPSYLPPNPYHGQQNNYYPTHPPPPQVGQVPIYQTAPPPPNTVFVNPPNAQEPEKKQGFFKGGLGNTLAQSAVGGVGFGAGSAVGSGIINSIF